MTIANPVVCINCGHKPQLHQLPQSSIRVAADHYYCTVPDCECMKLQLPLRHRP